MQNGRKQPDLTPFNATHFSHFGQCGRTVKNSIIFQTDCQGLQEISLIMDVYRLALKVKSFLQ